MGKFAGLLLGGLALILTAMFMVPIVIDGFAESGQVNALTSFSGGSSFNNVLPTLFFGFVLILFVSLIGLAFIMVNKR